MRLIDVDALCDEIESVEYSGHDPEVERICSLIQKAKWIDAEPIKRGEWVDAERTIIEGKCKFLYLKCSRCGYERKDFTHELDTPYCPYCGAKMEADHE